MSHGKETPRQKMINLMYLILTCLLALNVSRDVLWGFVNINESLEKTNLGFASNSVKMLEAAEEAVNQGHHEVKPYLMKAKQNVKLTEDLIVYIDSMKKQVIRYTENKEGADTLKLGQTEKLDDYDRPTFFLLGDDEVHPRSGLYSATELREKLEWLSDTLMRQVIDMNNHPGTKLPEKDFVAMKNRINLFRPQRKFEQKGEQPLSWEMKNFLNQPMAAVVTNLSRMQGDIRNLHAELVNLYVSAAGKLAVHFDEMQAHVLSQSRYVMAGDPFRADVFLSATSSSFKDDNLQVILGDMDTATGKLAPGVTVLPLEQGSGKINLPSGPAGHHDVRGWIRLRDGTGRYKYFPYKEEYLVANSAVAVSPDKMNVFYMGVDNPVSISAAGIAPSDLVVKVEGGSCTLKEVGPGKYTIRPAGTGQAVVNVFAKSGSELKKQGVPMLFRLKKIPNPPLRISSRTINEVADMGLSEIRNWRRLDLDLSAIEFNAGFKIKRFSVIMGGVGNTQFFPCTGDELSPAALQALQRLPRGSKIYVEDVMVEAPEGERRLPMIKVNVR